MMIKFQDWSSTDLPDSKKDFSIITGVKEVQFVQGHKVIRENDKKEWQSAYVYVTLENGEHYRQDLEETVYLLNKDGKTFDKFEPHWPDDLETY